MRTTFIHRLGTGSVCGVLMLLTAASPAFADSIRDQQWHLSALDVVAAHRLTEGAGISVAVVDTGVKADHRDLAGNVLPGTDFNKSGTKGWVDTDGHGTAMAGLIAGHGHGAGHTAGVLGIAPEAKIIPIRVLKDNNRATTDIPAAIDDAVRRGARVISMSLGTTNTPELDSALARAIAADVVLVSASGNRPKETFVQFPARYPGVVAVAATARNGKLAPISVTGKEVVLSAPGADIISTSNTGAYEQGDGTSASTAIVAGAAALVRARFPKLSAAEVVHRLTATATDKGAPGRDSEYGFGELNLVAALTADVPPATARPSVTGATGPATAPATGASGAAAPPAGSAMRVDWVAVGVVLAAVAFVVVVIVVLIVWLVVRGRRRRGPPAGFSGGGQYRAPDQRAGGNQRGTFGP
jgi:type VII secretion-associated serine protease mycosin